MCGSRSAAASGALDAPRYGTGGGKELLDPGAPMEPKPERALLGFELEFEAEKPAAPALEKQPFEGLMCK